MQTPWTNTVKTLEQARDFVLEVGICGILHDAKGALPTLYAATMDVPGNTYLGPHRFREMIGWPTPVGRSDRALDPELAKALWTESERLSGVTFPL